MGLRIAREVGASDSGWLMMYSAYKLNKQGDNLQPCLILCPILKHFVVPGKNTGVGCHFLLQGIFPAQGSNL